MGIYHKRNDGELRRCPIHLPDDYDDDSDDEFVDKQTM